MVVTLIGYRGTGKSSVAPMLASRWGWDWIDADAEIEQTAGQSIADIFAEGGEPAFRAVEREVMQRLLRADRLIIAAGGGAILDVRTRNEMREAGPVVWLQASVETIARRLDSDPTTQQRRPGLTDRDARTEIELLLAQRTPLYAELATVTVSTDQHAVTAIVDQLDEALSGQCRRENP